MIASHVANCVVSGDELAATACWQLATAPFETLFVINDDQRLTGFLNKYYHFPRYSESKKHITALEACRKDVQFVYDTDDYFGQARNIFAEYPTITSIPVVNRDMRLCDVVFRFECFYEEYYATAKAMKGNTRSFFPYPVYAACMWDAALVADKAGYDAFSVIEFGVAGGNGLVACEYHADAIRRKLGLEVQVYGFDTGHGLPKPSGVKDLHYIWPEGSFRMDVEALKARLRKAILVLGDIRETLVDFVKVYNPAPVGAMLIDVDFYSSTVPILDFLEQDHMFFLPIISMYFDDIGFGKSEFQGEALAIREFNSRNGQLKISPEGIDCTPEGRFF